MGPMAPSPEKEEEPGWNSMEQPGYMAARRQEAEESEQNPLLSIFFFLAYLPRLSFESVDGLLVTFHFCHYISELVGHRRRWKAICTVSNPDRQGVSNLGGRQRSLGCQLGRLPRDTSPVQRATKAAGMAVLFNKTNKAMMVPGTHTPPSWHSKCGLTCRVSL